MGTNVALQPLPFIFMDHPLLPAMMAVGMYFFLHALPFLAFGMFIFNRLRKTSFVFILYSAVLTAWRASGENKTIAIHEMHDAGFSTAEIDASWQVWLPMVLRMFSTVLVFVAFVSLAVSIRRLSKTAAN